MVVSKENIIQYIPQRPPFVMIDNVVDIDKEKVLSDYKISNENPLIKDGYFQEGGLIENVAQTAAAGAGYESVSNNKPVNIGFIGSVKNLKTYSLPKPGDIIETETLTISKIMNANIIKGKVKSSGITLMECEINIFMQEQ